jgi:hypothetical protein
MSRTSRRTVGDSLIVVRLCVVLVEDMRGHVGSYGVSGHVGGEELEKE